MIDWAKFNSWNMVLPPNRPDGGNIKHLATICSMLPKREAACVLGSTPEYRALLSPLFEVVYVIDHSTEFKEISDRICGHVPNEVFINEDWLSALGGLSDNFDLIASHFTHGNIRFERRSWFFQGIANSLKNSGVFFDTIFNPPEFLYGVQELEQRFRLEPLNLQTLNVFNAMAVFQSEPIGWLGCIDTKEIYEWLQRHSPSQHFGRLLTGVMDITPPGLVWDYAPGRTAETFGYRNTFEVIQEVSEPLASPFARAVRTLVSRRG